MQTERWQSTACLVAGLGLAVALTIEDLATAPARTALIIGNSQYEKLNTLKNAVGDARAVADTFRGMGYSTRLITDVTHEQFRREIRQFAGASANAEIALVFYAGHGAQVAGVNYLLPVEMEIPSFDSDISLEGIKVDDVVNSLRSRTKVVLLDACRDNPALFKNLATGRGSRTVGFAPANAGQFDLSATGGGVFIAYAADSGAVAADGSGAHSPFTEALLRHVPKPLSIDDVFSLVTRDVRLLTNNTQRPYKYASLESIVCLAENCDPAAPLQPSDPASIAGRSESEDFKVALESKTTKSIYSFLMKYPESTRHDEAVDWLFRLRRAQFDEWPIFHMGIDGTPFRMQFSSVDYWDGRAAVKVRTPALPGPGIESPPVGSYAVSTWVFDCSQPLYALSETVVYSSTAETLWRYKYGDPRLIDLPNEVGPRSINATLRYLVCSAVLRTPLVDRVALNDGTFRSVASTSLGDGEVLYSPAPPLVPRNLLGDTTPRGSWRQCLTMTKLLKDTPLVEIFPPLKLAGTMPRAKTIVNLQYIRCDTSQYFHLKSEAFDSDDQLVFTWVADPSVGSWTDIAPNGAGALLKKLVCSDDRRGQ